MSIGLTDLVYTRDEAYKVLKIGKNIFLDLLRNKEIHEIKISERIRLIPRVELEAYIERKLADVLQEDTQAAHWLLGVSAPEGPAPHSSQRGNA